VAELARSGAGRPAPAPAAGKLEVRVARRAGTARPAADLRVIAAPVEMWREVPEDSLPSWPVPADGRLVVPVDGLHGWRVRLAGTGEGSWWADARPRAASIAIQSVPAGGINLVVEDENGRPAGSVGAFIKEGAERLRDSRSWAGIRGKGRLTAAGLPDAREVTLDVVAAGYPPVVVRGWPGALPRRVRLRRTAAWWTWATSRCRQAPACTCWCGRPGARPTARSRERRRA
jgi:hypothetical protein